MVQHLEPHNLQFAIATALLVVFILMVCPLAKLLKHFQDAQARRQGAQEPLLPGNTPEGETLRRQHPSILDLHSLLRLTVLYNDVARKVCMGGPGPSR